jgi:protein TonB
MFKIDKNGYVTGIRARGPHVDLENEAIRTIGLLPNMIPGKQKGKNVGVKYTLPITLLVEKKKRKRRKYKF